MTNFILNLSKHYNDLSIALPFWYDLMAEQELHLTKTSGAALLSRIDEGLQEIKTALSFTYSHQWRLIVVVERGQKVGENPYTASLYAKCLAIQSRLEQSLKNSIMRAPQDILMICLDAENDEFIRHPLHSFARQSIDFDHQGWIPTMKETPFFSPSLMEQLNKIWQEAEVDTKGQNIEDVPQRLNTKVQQALSKIQVKTDEVLNQLPPAYFLLEKELSIFPKTHIEAIRQAIEEEFLHTQSNPKEWNDFRADRKIQDILRQKNSLFALPIRQQFTFLRLSVRHVLQDLIKFALLVRILVQHDKKVIPALQKEEHPLWKNLDLDRKSLANMLSAYLRGLKEVKRELEQLKTVKAQTKSPVKQYKAAVFMPINLSKLPDFKIKTFTFSWFNHIQTLPNFLNWTANLDQKLRQQRDATPTLIQECHLNNVQKNQEQYTEEWTESECQQQMNTQKAAYEKIQQMLNNALQHTHIFQAWKEKKAENEQIAHEQFGKRPSKRIFFVSLLVAMITLSVPYLLGWYYVQDSWSWWTIGVGSAFLIFSAIWLWYQIIKPIKLLIVHVVLSAKETKKAIQLELKKQEYYIENIIQSAVLRKNIHQLEAELSTFQARKQLVEYHSKEADYHSELIYNLIKNLKLSASPSSTLQDLNIQEEQLHQAFNKNTFAWIFEYLKEKEKLEMNVSNTPIRVAEFDKLGVLIHGLNFQEDRTI